MALINVATREIHCKIVYYGPGMGGKTSNLQFIHKRVPDESGKGKLLSIETETERTLFFDFLPLEIGSVGSGDRKFQVRLHLYTVPGQVIYHRTRTAVLNGADGVVFVADSQWRKLKENIDSIKELYRNITEQQNKPFREFPIVLQYNKRDLPESARPAEGAIVPVNELDRYLNALKWQRFNAVASRGDGVLETLRSISKLVISKL